jgi:glutaredoxin
MPTQLTLYSTQACHLCERAEALLASMPELRRYPLQVVDVSASEVLIGRYGMSIPVLAYRGHELFWPFNADDVLMLVRVDG